jgi:acyl homoserine lactone synthase
MILAIESVDRHAYPGLFEQMFRMRAAVFSERLGWDVTVVDGKEIDRFDDEDPLYLLCVDELTNELKGAVRLLPTTGPNMLRDVFAVLVPGGSVESPLIWESSRFAINPALSDGPGRHVNQFVNTTTVELLCGLVEAAQLAGVEHIVSVFDARMARIFRAADCPYELIGVPTRIGRTMTYAGLFEISDSMRQRLGNAGCLPATVLASSGAGLAAIRSA